MCCVASQEDSDSVSRVFIDYIQLGHTDHGFDIVVIIFVLSAIGPSVSISLLR